MKHPENLKDNEAVKITQEIKDKITSLSQDIEEAKQRRGVWDTRQEDYYRKRFQLRRKRNFPWAGYPNYILPLIDSDIQKAKPAYINAAFGVYPIVTYEPFNPQSIQAARNREALLDYRIKHKMDFFEPYCIGVDKALQTGFVVFKIIWKFASRKYSETLDISDLPPEVQDALYDVITTDAMIKKIAQEEFSVDMDFAENDEALDKMVSEFREGKTEFKMTFMEKEHNKAEVIACDPKEDIVVPADTQNIQDARFVDYRFYSTINELKIAMRDGKYEKFSDDELMEWTGKETRSNRQDKLHREGITESGLSEELVYLHETCVWHDIDGDGIMERCIATWPNSAPEKVLRFIENPYDHGRWPYEQVERELIDVGFYSARGIPALDDDFQTGISASFNNDLANQLIVNTPFIKYTKNAVTNIRNRKFIPGEAVEVRDMNGYSVEQSVNSSQGAFMVTQQQLKAWAQERIGNQSAGLTAINNPTGNGQGGKKTAREIEEISSVSGQSQTLDITTWQMQMKWVYYQIDSLYFQFGEEEEFIMTGEEPQKVSRRDIQGRFNMVPTGKLDNSHPGLRAQKSFQVFEMFRGDPGVRQDELYQMVIGDLHDSKTAKRLLISKEERAQQAQAQIQAQEQAKQKAVVEAVEIKRLGSMVELEKELGMAEIHGRKFAPDPQEESK